MNLEGISEILCKRGLQMVDQGAVDEAGFSGGTPLQTTHRLIRDNVGERLAAEALSGDGRYILMYKPDTLGGNSIH
jgi:hypothetical protein